MQQVHWELIQSLTPSCPRPLPRSRWKLRSGYWYNGAVGWNCEGLVCWLASVVILRSSSCMMFSSRPQNHQVCVVVVVIFNSHLPDLFVSHTVGAQYYCETVGVVSDSWNLLFLMTDYFLRARTGYWKPFWSQSLKEKLCLTPTKLTASIMCHLCITKAHEKFFFVTRALISQIIAFHK